MPYNSFAPWSTNPNCFVVINIGKSPPKTIKIFNYPINYGQTRDLLRIPGVDESDIRGSLLKGELNHKIRTNEIYVLCSDIDLLQFNASQKIFLQNAGITNGLDAGGSGGITATEHETLRQLIHFIDSGGPADGFISGAYRVILPIGSPFPTSVTWWINNTQTQKLVEKLITYNASEIPILIVWNMYDVDGVTIIHTVSDSITYSNNVFEHFRNRTII